MTALAIRVRRAAASRRPRVAAALAAATLMAALTASLTGAARQPITLYPVQAAFASPGPYATTTGTVTEQVTIAGSDPNNPSFVTTSFRQTAPNSTDMIEIFSINIASGSSMLFTLDSGDYAVVSSTFGLATQVIPVPNSPLFHVGDGTNTDLIVNF